MDAHRGVDQGVGTSTSCANQAQRSSTVGVHQQLDRTLADKLGIH